VRDGGIFFDRDTSSTYTTCRAATRERPREGLDVVDKGGVDAEAGGIACVSHSVREQQKVGWFVLERATSSELMRVRNQPCILNCNYRQIVEGPHPGVLTINASL
jgi:hypothetical protein